MIIYNNRNSNENENKNNSNQPLRRSSRIAKQGLQASGNKREDEERTTQVEPFNKRRRITNSSKMQL